MIPKKALEIVNKTLKVMSSNGKPFGNKLIILGGDFRQILPVVKNGTERKIIEETIKFSQLWPLFKVLKLNKNLRCIDKEFSELLLKIGDGKIENFIIPESWKTDDVCSKINGNVNNNNIENSVILAPHNEEIDQLNSKILKLMN